MISSKSNIGNSFSVQFQVKTHQIERLKQYVGKVGLITGVEEKGIVIPASVIVGTVAKPRRI